jgi:hypothetical protein
LMTQMLAMWGCQASLKRLLMKTWQGGQPWLRKWVIITLIPSFQLNVVAKRRSKSLTTDSWIGGMPWATCPLPDLLKGKPSQPYMLQIAYGKTLLSWRRHWRSWLWGKVVWKYGCLLQDHRLIHPGATCPISLWHDSAFEATHAMAVQGRDIVMASHSPAMITPPDAGHWWRDNLGLMNEGSDCVAGRAPGGSKQPRQTLYEDIPSRRTVCSQDTPELGKIV